MASVPTDQICNLNLSLIIKIFVIPEEVRDIFAIRTDFFLECKQVLKLAAQNDSYLWVGVHLNKSIPYLWKISAFLRDLKGYYFNRPRQIHNCI